jgi:hypothetical protein
MLTRIAFQVNTFLFPFGSWATALLLVRDTYLQLVIRIISKSPSTFAVKY